MHVFYNRGTQREHLSKILVMLSLRRQIALCSFNCYKDIFLPDCLDALSENLTVRKS